MNRNCCRFDGALDDGGTREEGHILLDKFCLAYPIMRLCHSTNETICPFHRNNCTLSLLNCNFHILRLVLVPWDMFACHRIISK